jgi:hypothetical protein
VVAVAAAEAAAVAADPLVVAEAAVAAGRSAAAEAAVGHSVVVAGNRVRRDRLAAVVNHGPHDRLVAVSHRDRRVRSAARRVRLVAIQADRLDPLAAKVVLHASSVGRAIVVRVARLAAKHEADRYALLTVVNAAVNSR